MTTTWLDELTNLGRFDPNPIHVLDEAGLAALPQGTRLADFEGDEWVVRGRSLSATWGNGWLEPIEVAVCYTPYRVLNPEILGTFGPVKVTRPFAPGDKVRVLEDLPLGADLHTGDIATVVKVDAEDEEAVVQVDGDHWTWYVKFHHIELVGFNGWQRVGTGEVFFKFANPESLPVIMDDEAFNSLGVGAVIRYAPEAWGGAMLEGQIRVKLADGGWYKPGFAGEVARHQLAQYAEVLYEGV